MIVIVIDLAFIPKARKTLSDQGLEETYTKFTQKETISESKGNKVCKMS